MNTELRKRIEEAAEKDINSMKDDCYIHYNSFTEECYRDGFKVGAEYGYKEAIKVAKEWMQNYFPDELDGKGFEFVSRDEIIADFETDMNKLWEESK